MNLKILKKISKNLCKSVSSFCSAGMNDKWSVTVIPFMFSGIYTINRIAYFSKLSHWQLFEMRLSKHSVLNEH